MTYLFSYGSNNPAQLEERLGHDVEMFAAYLPGYCRVFRGFSRRWGGGTASLEPCERTTYGYVAVVSARDLTTLDRYEGVGAGIYRREIVHVRAQDVRDAAGLLRAVAYVHTSNVFSAPTRAYLDAVARTIGTFWHNPDGSPVTPANISVR